MPDFPLGFAEPDKKPRFPQRFAEIMGGRIADIEDGCTMVPKSLKFVTIGELTGRRDSSRQISFARSK